MIRAVVFDLGKVLASGEEIFTVPAGLLDVDPDRFAELYWAGRRGYDEGRPDADYWGPILTGLGRPPTVETMRHLAALDAELWLKLRPQARQLLADVRASGRLVAVLSNAPSNIDQGLLSADFNDEADYWFVSASMGVTKPHAEAYARVTEVLNLDPTAIAFIDDRPENVAGAERAGWTAHVWISDADTRAWLESLGVLPAAQG
ncbi:MAG: HAD-IA family hydrolase [Propioniciclava sp.]